MKGWHASTRRSLCCSRRTTRCCTGARRPAWRRASSPPTPSLACRRCSTAARAAAACSTQVLQSPLLATSPLPFRGTRVAARRRGRGGRRPASRCAPLVRAGGRKRRAAGRLRAGQAEGAGIVSTPPLDAVLELSGVHKTYRLGQHVVPALQGVDLRVLPGEMLALTGPSGSGKSTLLNLAGLIDQPDRGEVRLRGQRGRRHRRDRGHAAAPRRHRLRVPELQPGAGDDGGRQRRLPAVPRRRAGGRAPRARGRRCCAPWAWPSTPRTGPTRCRAASASAWRSRARWSSGRRW